MRKGYLQGEDIETIYLGGGTPSQLEKEDFEQLFETIFRIYPVNDQAEITLEANPDDLTPEYLKMLSQQPFNRLSMGIQTFNEHTLKLLHRRHTAQQAIEAFYQSREAGLPEHQHRPDVRSARVRLPKAGNMIFSRHSSYSLNTSQPII